MRRFIQHEMALTTIFASAGLQLVYPISGESGIISKREISGLFDCLSTQGLFGLDLVAVQMHASEMQKILGQ